MADIITASFENYTSTESLDFGRNQDTFGHFFQSDGDSNI